MSAHRGAAKPQAEASSAVLGAVPGAHGGHRGALAAGDRMRLAVCDFKLDPVSPPMDSVSSVSFLAVFPLPDPMPD